MSYTDRATAALKRLATELPGTSTARHLLRSHSLKILETLKGLGEPDATARLIWQEAAKLNDEDFATTMYIDACGPTVQLRRRRGGFAQVWERFTWIELLDLKQDEVAGRLTRALETLKATRPRYTLAGDVLTRVKRSIWETVGPAPGIISLLQTVNEVLSQSGYRILEADMRDGQPERVAFDRVIELAQRQLDQDRGHLSGPSITREMLQDVADDEAAIKKFRELLSDENHS